MSQDSNIVDDVMDGAADLGDAAAELVADVTGTSRKRGRLLLLLIIIGAVVFFMKKQQHAQDEAE